MDIKMVISSILVIKMRRRNGQLIKNRKKQRRTRKNINVDQFDTKPIVPLGTKVNIGNHEYTYVKMVQPKVESVICPLCNKQITGDNQTVVLKNNIPIKLHMECPK